MKKFYFSFLLILGAATMLSFQNCSKQNFAVVDPLMKSAVLENHMGYDSLEDCETMDCDFDKNPPGSNSGGSNNGSSNGGSSNGSSSNGGSVSGGSNNGGSSTGGSSTGGSTGGTTGGSTTGGNTGGGNSTGGSVSGGNSNGGSSNGGSSNGGSSNGGSSNGGSTGGPTVLDNDFDLPIKRMCSYARTKNGKKSLAQAKEIHLKVHEGSKVVCQKSGLSILTEITKDALVNMENCSLNPAKEYTVTLVNEKNESLFEDDDKDKVTKLSFKKSKAQKVTVLYDTNPKEDAKNMTLEPGDCDQVASPLVVDFRSLVNQRNPYFLGAPEHGVEFDILGLNSKPGAYVKKQISWFKSSSIMPIVLPNSKGQVLGINEMFGDNTLGPDNDFAANGFAALAKHDLNGDKVIDASDLVFKKLRLWSDRNRDGIADSGELYRLEELNVTLIDLDFDDKYFLLDRHGNQYKYKSVLKLGDDSLQTVFDIWFYVDSE